MDRQSGERYGTNPESYRHNSSRGGGPSRFSDGPMDLHHQQRDRDHRSSPTSFRVGFSGGGPRDHRPFDSPPRYPTPGSSGVESGPGGGGVARPIVGGGGGGFSPNQQMPPLSGQKRGYPFSGRVGGSPDRFDAGSFAKLFVGSVPRTATDEDIRPLFEEHGRVVEVALIKDKRTGQQQGCCFVKYATSEEADMAIRALHNQHTLPGGLGPIQVRYADGERERLGAVEHKLFVASLNKQATEKEVEEIFSPYGRVEDVYLMRDEMKQSRGCGFVKFSHREMALAAINALNGVYTMRGCDQPLSVRFADPKRPRPGESRGGTAFGGPGFSPRFQSPGIRPTQNLGEPIMHGSILPNAWQTASPQNQAPQSNAGIHGYVNQLPHRSAEMAASSMPGGTFGSFSGTTDGFLPGVAVSSVSTSQQNFNQSFHQVPSAGVQISPLMKTLQSPQHLPSSLQLQPHTLSSHSQGRTSDASLQQLGQRQVLPTAGQIPFSQAIPSQQLLGVNGQLSVSQPQVQQNSSSITAQAPLSSNLQPHVLSAMANQSQLPAQQQLLQPQHQSPSQLAQMLSQQTQTLQASFQSSQQAFSQLQQQLQMMQPSNQSLTAQQNSQAAKQQSPWAGIVPHTVSNTPAITTVAGVPPATSAAPTVPLMNQVVASAKSSWTEHTSPDGYKYYHNSATGESKWEKPEELTLYERQQQQKPSIQQPTPSHTQGQSTQQIPQTQQVQHQIQLQTQLQNQLHHSQQLRQTTQSSSYQAPGAAGHQNIQELGYTQLPVTASSINDPARFQQGGLQAAQEWMWKNNPTGA